MHKNKQFKVGDRVNCLIYIDDGPVERIAEVVEVYTGELSHLMTVRTLGGNEHHNVPCVTARISPAEKW